MKIHRLLLPWDSGLGALGSDHMLGKRKVVPIDGLESIIVRSTGDGRFQFDFHIGS
jgi:hypothetical protein